MVIFLDGCMDSADWVEEVSGYRPATDLTLEQLEALTQENDTVREARGMYFDYPLSETTYITDNADLFDNVQLVRFLDGFGGYEYRWCEVQ